jgi:hypothetical protein
MVIFVPANDDEPVATANWRPREMLLFENWKPREQVWKISFTYFYSGNFN